jgi:uncharacterized membrane protein YecN with MAPEG domain
MNPLWEQPAVRTYAVCAAILALKMLYSAVYTGMRRQKYAGYINAEDARVFGGGKSPVLAAESPEVAHALRIQRNDIESIPIFFAIGLVYALTIASPFGATVYFWTYTVARVVHTLAYTRHIQPLRAICFVLASLCVVGMSTQLILAGLR